MRIEEKVAIAAGHQAVGPAQDRPYLVAQVMVAPVARGDGLVAKQFLGEPAVRRPRVPSIKSTEIEYVPQLGLLWQGTIARAEPMALQRPPEPARRVEPGFEIVIKRQDNSIDVEQASWFSRDDVICLLCRRPENMNLVGFCPALNPAESTGRLRGAGGNCPPRCAKNPWRGLFCPDDVFRRERLGTRNREIARPSERRSRASR